MLSKHRHLRDWVIGLLALAFLAVTSMVAEVATAQDFRQLQNLPGFNAPPDNLDPSRWQNPTMSGLAGGSNCVRTQPENFGDFIQRFSKDQGFQAERISSTLRVVTRTAPAPTKTNPGVQVTMLKKQDYEANRGLLAPLAQSPKGLQAFRVGQTVYDAQAQTADGLISVYRFVMLGNCWHLAAIDR